VASNIVLTQNSKGKSKEGVDCDAANIQRGNAGWCANSDILLGVFNQVAKQSGFSGSGTTGDKNVVLRLLDVVKEVLLLY
jgi:hypothetical protein